MSKELTFTIKSIRFDEDYSPSATTRLTTNFANLARGESRQENLRNTLRMINNRFNSLAHWDNPKADRYSIELEIISAELQVDGENPSSHIPLIEVLKTKITDHQSEKTIQGIVGNSFSSYVRDYDFSVRLIEHNKNRPSLSIPDDFGDLHGKLFKSFIRSEAYKTHFNKPPVICLSVSTSKTYHRTENKHPVLGYEYTQNAYSLTDEYFKKMGLKVRYFMPPNSAAPFAFYFSGDLLSDYTDLELISTISTMDTFQRIYRPEIYNANSPAGLFYSPSLSEQDFSLTRIIYDRDERSQLAVEQGRFIEEKFIKPYGKTLEQWSAHYPH